MADKSGIQGGLVVDLLWVQRVSRPMTCLTPPSLGLSWVISSRRVGMAAGHVIRWLPVAFGLSPKLHIVHSCSLSSVVSYYLINGTCRFSPQPLFLQICCFTACKHCFQPNLFFSIIRSSAKSGWRRGRPLQQAVSFLLSLACPPAAPPCPSRVPLPLGY